jgi:hypothetical protein
MPKFTDPPGSPPVTPLPAPQTEAVLPSKAPMPVPVKRDSLINRSGSPSPVSANLFRSRSPSPANEPKASLSRSPSTQSGYIRGPRTSRGPRAPGGSNVGSLVSNMNRNSMTGSPPAPGYNRLSSSSSSRPQSMVGAIGRDTRARGIGQTQALSRRTMASDAEDEVVQ